MKHNLKLVCCGVIEKHLVVVKEVDNRVWLGISLVLVVNAI